MWGRGLPHPAVSHLAWVCRLCWSRFFSQVPRPHGLGLAGTQPWAPHMS